MAFDFAFSIAAFLVLISIVVVFHELGHYWFEMVALAPPRSTP